jgi:hypothetical protein
VSIGALRKITVDKRTTKINDKGRTCKGALGASLNPVGTYLMPLKWNEKNSTPSHSVSKLEHTPNHGD